MTRRTFSARALAAATASLALPGFSRAASEKQDKTVVSASPVPSAVTYVAVAAMASPGNSYALHVCDEHGIAVGIRGDGVVEFREGLSIDEASEKFWNGVSFIIRKNSAIWPVPTTIAPGLS